MASSPPGSPSGIQPPRPMSALVKPSPRSASRMSMQSRGGGASRASDEDSKTAVRVAVRVRPSLKPTDPGYELIPQRFQRSLVSSTSDTSIAIDSPQGKKVFVFDRVFSPEITQEGVWEYLNESVNAFLQGYNVSLLAYGQSGAGKSFTMGTSGPSEQGNNELMGVVPRAAIALFEKLDGTTPKNSKRSSMSQLRAPSRYSMGPPSTSKTEKNWQLKATYVEIYNEQLRDLLLPDSTPPQERSNVNIREDTKGNIILTGLRQLDINSVDDLLGALNFGSSIRQTDATAINAKSSRSHAVFSLNLVQRKAKTTDTADKRRSVPLEAMTGSETFVTTDSKLHFVDLAGSERLKNTGAQGERAREGISINAGLAALGKVISQLSSRQSGSHVSYRDSRLTRLLQDSLGGNAITYMIACVTPAEFHISETLNTVQYAQRARAIQSKPRIQQMEEGDKQAIIERLKAEVSFLRDQVRNAERSGAERRNATTGDKSDRNNERETELQNQLLDSQENYSSLSQRHAKLISEMAKARNDEAAREQAEADLHEDSATERLNRSNSFAQAVEGVVLEYEKTIQSLEQSLSSTRSTLSNTETNLLEKETKCAYVETINQQLQARVQKHIDREANTENYLQDLEEKLQGHASGQGRDAVIITELRKEIARARENEAGCEDYISTLEERLAEAIQDMELMQREMDRLEQVVERQRSLGKLDDLLSELDTINSDGKASESGSDPALNGKHRRTFSERSMKSHVSRPSLAMRDMLPDVKEGTEEDSTGQRSVREGSEAPRDNLEPGSSPDDLPPSPAQSKFVADKLENVTQELLDLRVEHESAVHENNMLHSKYEEALRTMADLQDQIDEARHSSSSRPRDSFLSATSPDQTRPPSFLSDARSSDVKDGTQYSSRSLSSELSSAIDSPATAETTQPDLLRSDSKETLTTENEPKSAELGEDRTIVLEKAQAAEESARAVVLAAELEKLKSLAGEKEAKEHELTSKYAQLEEKHQDALDMVEELKTEIAKVKFAADPPSPRTAGPVIRRKSSQNVMNVDRAQRSFSSLRKIATENFEEDPDVMQSFEVNLNTAMHELIIRSDRIQELEADIASAKKEMETKMTIITGLTRERSSLQATPMDVSMVAQMKGQLEHNEKQLHQLQVAHEAREAGLMAELEKLREALTNQSPASPSADSSEQAKKISGLETELASWESKHNDALEAMLATEKKMKETIEDLEAQVVSVNAKLGESNVDGTNADDAKEIESKHQNTLAFLRNEIDEYKAIINSNASKVAELEEAHAATKKDLEEATQARDTSATDDQKALVEKLESQIADHEKSLKSHQDSLAELQTNHAKEVEAIRASSKEDYDSQLQALTAEHAEKSKLLEADAAGAREELTKIATQVALALGLEASVDKLAERIDQLTAAQSSDSQDKTTELENQISELSTTNTTVLRDLEGVKSVLNDMLLTEGDDAGSQYPSVQDQIAAVKKKMGDLETKNKKHSRLVEELEDQLQTNYDQAQLTNNRLSTLQSERNAQLDEAQAAKLKLQGEIESLREEMASLQSQAQAQAQSQSQSRPDDRTNSISSQAGATRKTNSVVSLPSPPPAIPLPPLPPNSGSSPQPGSPTPQSPTNGRPQSNDMNLTQIREDQEARIRSLDRALKAERQLTTTLEEALTDLENQSKSVKVDSDAWKKRAQELEAEVQGLKEKPQQDNRWRDSLHAIEEERKKREAAERARTQLEERMAAINQKKKKKGSLNCF